MVSPINLLYMSTIVEVAKRAKVSTATVSNVIRGTRKVSGERTKRVQAAIRELNYFPNEIARSLKVKQTRMLALVLPDITNPFFPEIIRGAEDTAFARGYFLLTANTDEQPGRERRIIAALRSYRVDGILLASAQGTHGHDRSPIRDMVDAGVSVVCLDRALPDVATDAVLLDNVGGARECVRHLIKQGHRRIAIITGALHLQTGHERLQGYKLALEDAGILVDPKFILEGDFRSESGSRLGEQLMKQRLKPTAIFVCNGVMALGVLHAFERLKINCPRDVALATFDDVSVDHLFSPHLTAVIQPSYEMGSRAATMLIDRIEGLLGKQCSVVRVAPKLVLRDSTSLQIARRARRS
jgi:LacI family transcriptional regulator